MTQNKAVGSAAWTVNSRGCVWVDPFWMALETGLGSSKCFRSREIKISDFRGRTFICTGNLFYSWEKLKAITSGATVTSSLDIVTVKNPLFCTVGTSRATIEYARRKKRWPSCIYANIDEWSLYRKVKDFRDMDMEITLCEKKKN